MKFADIENVWSVDVKLLSNADRGRVYYERAKQVVGEGLSDPKERSSAVEGRRFRRTYLIEKIGCAASVPAQNPKIKALLADADRRVVAQLGSPGFGSRSARDERMAELNRLRVVAAALQRRVEEQEELIDELRRKLR